MAPHQPAERDGFVTKDPQGKIIEKSLRRYEALGAIQAGFLPPKRVGDAMVQTNILYPKEASHLLTVKGDP